MPGASGLRGGPARMSSPGRSIDGALLPRWSSRLRLAVARKRWRLSLAGMVRAHCADGAQVVGVRGYVEPAIGIGLKNPATVGKMAAPDWMPATGPVGRRTRQPAGPPNGAARVDSRPEVLAVGQPEAL